jgi:hypothetical protein
MPKAQQPDHKNNRPRRLHFFDPNTRLKVACQRTTSPYDSLADVTTTDWNVVTCKFCLGVRRVGLPITDYDRNDKKKNPRRT